MSGDERHDEKEAVWNIRVRPTLDSKVDEAIMKDTHSTKSEFIRQAVREKLEKMGISLQIADLNGGS